MNACITLQDPRFNYSYKGFCSIVCAIVDIALEHHSFYGNLNCSIHESQTLKLFDNLYDNEGIEYDTGSWWLDRFFGNQLSYSEYNAHTLANIENLKIKNQVLNSILQIKSNKVLQFDNTFTELGITDRTLGVQIRGTDKKNEVKEPDLDNIIKKIDYYFETTNVQNIFLATDDLKYLNALLNRYGDLVIYDDKNTISSDNTPLHTLSDRDRINEEVLSSVYLLSKCSHFLYSFSNVSLLALILGVHNFQTILNLNQE